MRSQDVTTTLAMDGVEGDQQRHGDQGREVEAAQAEGF
jgi:hypothetical protein